ncbi:hypothetical protein GCM10023238_18600 [Streptomyces heliomycini]
MPRFVRTEFTAGRDGQRTNPELDVRWNADKVATAALADLAGAGTLSRFRIARYRRDGGGEAGPRGCWAGSRR